MQTAIWILSGAALGGGCGYGAICWSHRMLKAREHEERVSPKAQRLLVPAAAVCGGVIGFLTGQLLPLLAALAVLTIGLAVAICDWMCRIIPNDTVLAVMGLKVVLVLAALLKIPGAPPMALLSSLGGLAFCFAVFFAPGLMGKQVGAGDVKLAAAMGFLLGFYNALFAIMIMGVVMLGYSFAQRQMPILTFLRSNIPMGPFIAAGMLAVQVLTSLS